MVAVARTDTSTLGRWMWTVDMWSIAAMVVLMAFGAILSVAASPPVAEHLGYGEYHFVVRHLVMTAPALVVLIVTSLMEPSRIRDLAVVVLGLATAGVAATLVFGVEIKGATRWLHIAGFSVQPSEFVKPALVVVTGWLLAEQRLRDRFPGYVTATVLLLGIVGLLMLQPDLGMTVVIIATWGVQIFLAGLPIIFVAILAALAISGLIGSYFLFDHVATRINSFLDPASGDSYQIDRALEAFGNGGLWGLGPGEGMVKHSLPDAHADFVFAVAGEEFGLLWCLALVALFAFIVLRGLSRVFDGRNLFALIAGAGLLVQFGLQALINMTSTLNLIPTKGMTLPFISYGGSSMIAIALGMGMMLGLTRKRREAGGGL